MKKTLFLALIGLAFFGLVLIGQSLLPDQAAAQTIPATRAFRMPWQDPFNLIYPSADIAVKEAFGSRPGWELNKSATWADISTSGIADTAWGDTIVWYGQLIRTGQMDSWPTLGVTGLDSGIVSLAYRWVAYNANTIAAGAWSDWGGVATLTVPRQYAKGKGGGRDTLIVPLLQPVDAAATDSTSAVSFAASETGYLQYRATFISTRAKKVAGFKTNIVQPRAGFNYTWRGEVIITARRTAQ